MGPYMNVKDHTKYVVCGGTETEARWNREFLMDCLQNSTRRCNEEGRLTKEYYSELVSWNLRGHERRARMAGPPDVEIYLTDEDGRPWAGGGSDDCAGPGKTREAVIKEYWRQKKDGADNPEIDVIALGYGPVTYAYAQYLIENDPMSAGYREGREAERIPLIGAEERPDAGPGYMPEYVLEYLLGEKLLRHNAMAPREYQEAYRAQQGRIEGKRAYWKGLTDVERRLIRAMAGPERQAGEEPEEKAGLEHAHFHPMVDTLDFVLSRLGFMEGSNMALFMKEFTLENMRINGDRIPNVWQMYGKVREAIDYFAGIRKMAESLASGEVSIPDMLEALGEYAVGAVVGNLIYVIENYEMYARIPQLPEDEVKYLAKRTSWACQEAIAIVLVFVALVSAAKGIAAGKAKPGTGKTAKPNSNSKGGGKLKPQNLMDELAKSGVKHSPKDVVTVTKTPDGKLMWLEKGNSSSGLTHITERHASHFAERGIKDIPNFLNRTLQQTPVKTGTTKVGPFAEYLIDGKMYRVGHGTNGYVVSFYPIG